MRINKDCGVWITGGASGLGAACATRMRNSGAPVLVLDLNEDGRPFAESIGAEFLICDVSDAEAVQQVTSDGVKAFGIPRVLVSCAGIAPAARTVSRKGPHDAALFQKTIAVNLTGTYLMTAAVASQMAASEPLEDKERGVIINTASVAAFDGQVGQCAYAASKAAIAGMTLPLARDLASLGIRACAIAPGIFSTPMLDAMPEEVQQSLAAQVPFPSRLGQADEYAALAQHIIENRMLNGEVIRLDGAIRMGAR